MEILIAMLLFSIGGTSVDDLPGYRDTPVIPGQKWRVHDANRPRPKVVDPGKYTPPTRPAEAKVLLGEDGKLGAGTGWSRHRLEMVGRGSSGSAGNRGHFQS